MIHMKRHSVIFTAIACFALLALALSGFAKTRNVKTAIKNTEGKTIGWAMVKPAGQGVEINLTVKDMPPGEHAVHIHQSASCDAPDFKSAGGHFNPDSKQHGLQNPDGPHAGDLSNFHVASNGKAHVNIFAKSLDLGDDSHSIFSNGGTAIVIHAKPDDMKTDPAGNAGDRIACGVIKQ